ncbi:CDP-glycerol glycerophosphotransferase family protein [Rathayibacter sp. YIM 133350]|uniref:CDP-glycerol glycerophosphotransferase family protein n=1 Tax=Rathayibacter sp. YIM 133350 TaxID=3131992 RepID=UPI00307CD2AC
MGAVNDVRQGYRFAKRVLVNRRAQKQLAQKLDVAPPLKRGRFVIGVYFADGPVNLYQMRQWYEPLAELAKRWPVLVLSRTSGAASALLDECPVPVAYVRKVNDLEQVIAEQELRVILYVNQNAKNFQMMRYGRRWHVFINHGESDKMYMTTNQYKAYDYALIAGDAARARLERVLWDYDFDKRALSIGRPQADHYSGATPYVPDDREVVLYAPTWEGDRAAAAYGSIATHGVALVRSLLASPQHRVIYRPHPRSGVVDDAYRAADRAIVRMIEQANAADATAQHVYDTGPDLGWQLAAADVAIVDISAMVYDRLATGKPLLITRPVEPAAEIDNGGYLSDCEWLSAEDAPNIVRIVDDLAHGDEAQARLQVWVERYFGDTTPGAATARFHGAIEHLLSEWERNAALHADDGSVDERDRESVDEGIEPD